MKTKRTDLIYYCEINLLFFFSVMVLLGFGLLHGRIAGETAGDLHK